MNKISQDIATYMHAQIASPPPSSLPSPLIPQYFPIHLPKYPMLHALLRSAPLLRREHHAIPNRTKVNWFQIQNNSEVVHATPLAPGFSRPLLLVRSFVISSKRFVSVGLKVIESKRLRYCRIELALQLNWLRIEWFRTKENGGVAWMVYASFVGSTMADVGGVEADGAGGVDSMGSGSSSIFSCLIGGSTEPSCEELTSSTSIFLLLPFGAGSSGVRQYVTVLVTTCLTLTLPAFSIAFDGS